MIVTFYSYKGGVGRTQTVANMAAYLAFYCAQKVLLIDWDIEAPGLDYYFPSFKRENVEGGFMEILELYADTMRKERGITEEEAIEISNKLVINNITNTDGNGKIDFVAAGKYDDSYVSRMNAFRWDEFYENLDGRIFLEIWKIELRKQYDWILIDSRTGENDYSGICNILMPDRNVLVIAPNRQNVEGTYRMANKIQNSPYTKQGFRKPIVFPVLSRVEVDSPDFKPFLAYFKEKFEPILAKSELNIDIEAYFEESYIRYNKYLAINEQVSITKNENGRIANGSFEKVYAILYAYLSDEKKKKEAKIPTTKQEMSALLEKDVDAAFDELDKYFSENETYLALCKAYLEEKDQEALATIKSKLKRFVTTYFVEFQMVAIPEGTFEMGSEADEDSKPIHTVHLSAFEMGKYPVTQKQYYFIMGNNPSYYKGEDLPVTNVSWDDTQKFIRKLNEKQKTNFRLPTEAEWEYAAKGGEDFKYAGSDNIDEVAWYWANAGDKILEGEWSVDKVLKNKNKSHSVGQKKPNAYGLYDMSGNVWEWCEDVYDENFYQKCVDNKIVNNPLNHIIENKNNSNNKLSQKNINQICRGGSWISYGVNCRVSYRYRIKPTDCGNYIGFRILRGTQ